MKFNPELVMTACCWIVITLCVSSHTLADELDTRKPGDSGNGYTMLFAGHSYFIRVSQTLNEIVNRQNIDSRNQRFPDHEYREVFRGGANGSPEALWNDREGSKARPSAFDAIIAELEDGQVDLFALTYHDSQRPGIQFYQNWIDTALSYNPDVDILISFPWLTNGPTTDTDVFINSSAIAAQNFFENEIQSLRRIYPDTEIYFVDHGAVITQLKAEFDAQALESIDYLIREDRCLTRWNELLQDIAIGVEDDCENLPRTDLRNADRTPPFADNDKVYQFFDYFGHSGPLGLEAAASLWLHYLYAANGEELRDWFDPFYTTDILTVERVIRSVRADNRTRFAR